MCSLVENDTFYEDIARQRIQILHGRVNGPFTLEDMEEA